MHLEELLLLHSRKKKKKYLLSFNWSIEMSAVAGVTNSYPSEFTYVQSDALWAGHVPATPSTLNSTVVIVIVNSV